MKYLQFLKRMEHANQRMVQQSAHNVWTDEKDLAIQKQDKIKWFIISCKRCCVHHNYRMLGANEMSNPLRCWGWQLWQTWCSHQSKFLLHKTRGLGFLFQCSHYGQFRNNLGNTLSAPAVQKSFKMLMIILYQVKNTITQQPTSKIVLKSQTITWNL